MISRKSESTTSTNITVKQLPELLQGQTVWILDRKENGEVVDKHMTVRLYVVKTPATTVRRNRRHVISSSSPVKGNSVREDLTPQRPLTPKPVQSSDTPDEISKDSTNRTILVITLYKPNQVEL